MDHMTTPFRNPENRFKPQGKCSNDLIIRVTRNRLFTAIWGIPPYSEEYSEEDYESPERKKNTLYKTMGDCQIGNCSSPVLSVGWRSRRENALNKPE